ncbi:MAG: phospholipid-binding protein MlaC [bacterium]
MNIFRNKSFLIWGVTIAFFASFSPLMAGADESPLELIQARNETIKKIVDAAGDEVDDATREKLKDIINNMIDFRELSRRALGKYWAKRTDKEKDEFVDVFRRLIRNSSVKKLEIYRADRIEYSAAAVENDKATVATVAYKGRKNVEIIYKMHKVGDRWKIYDMVIDGVSTARNYRSSFYKQIVKTSYKEMYDKLVKRLGEE